VFCLHDLLLNAFDADKAHVGTADSFADRFCAAMIAIREEIDEIATGKTDRKDNIIKHAPHTAQTVSANEWNRSYSREKAAYPLPWLRESKFWSAVARIDNVHGDKNLRGCPPIEAYTEGG